MDQQAKSMARGLSTGAFLAMFLIPFILTYIVGWLSPFLGSASVVGAMAGDDTFSGTWLGVKAFLAALYICMAAASFLRGVANGTKWAVAFPLAAAVFDIVPGLSLIPFVPTILNVIALVVGVRAGTTTGPRVANREGS